MDSAESSCFPKARRSFASSQPTRKSPKSGAFGMTAPLGLLCTSPSNRYQSRSNERQLITLMNIRTLLHNVKHRFSLHTRIEVPAAQQMQSHAPYVGLVAAWVRMRLQKAGQSATTYSKPHRNSHGSASRPHSHRSRHCADAPRGTSKSCSQADCHSG